MYKAIKRFKVKPVAIREKWADVIVCKGYKYHAQMIVPEEREKLEIDKVVEIYGVMTEGTSGEKGYTGFSSKYIITCVSFSEEESKVIQKREMRRIATEKKEREQREREEAIALEAKKEQDKNRAKEEYEKWKIEHPDEYAKKLKAEEDAEKQRVAAQEAERRKRAAEKMLYWVEENAKEGKVYTKGIEVVKASGVQEYIEKVDRILDKFDLKDAFWFTSKENPDYSYKKGAIFIERGKVYKVLACKRAYEDEYTSFFPSELWSKVENGYYTLLVKDITNTEEGKQALKRQEDERLQYKRERQHKQNMLKLAEDIKKNGKKYTFDASNNAFEEVYKSDCFSNEVIEIYKGKTAYYLYHAYYGYDYSGKYPEWGRLTEYYRCNEALLNTELVS